MHFISDSAVLKDQRFSKSPLGNTKFHSQLSLNGHLCKTDTLLKRAPRVSPCLFFLLLVERDISLRQTLSAGSRGVCLRDSWLLTILCLQNIKYWSLEKDTLCNIIGSFSIDDGNCSRNVSFKMNSRFFNLCRVYSNLLKMASVD